MESKYSVILKVVPVLATSLVPNVHARTSIILASYTTFPPPYFQFSSLTVDRLCMYEATTISVIATIC